MKNHVITQGKSPGVGIVGQMPMGGEGGDKTAVVIALHQGIEDGGEQVEPVTGIRTDMRVGQGNGRL